MMNGELRQFLAWLCVAAFAIVVAALCTAVVRYHYSRRPLFHRSLVVELGWTLSPALIVLLVSFPAVSAVLVAQ